mgnify:CR=1 FL=1
MASVPIWCFVIVVDSRKEIKHFKGSQKQRFGKKAYDL